MLKLKRWTNGCKISFYLDHIEKLKKGEYIPPVTVEIDAANTCNLNCSFCMYKKYLKASQAVMTLDTYIQLIYNLKHIGVRSITFTGGGESLTNPNFNKFAQIMCFM